ncbi:MAG: helix-hairpin-helix domain-containing protein [Parasporobacterium sp.]|nr:helix-hairpin-helix domain-containing protein [Parasporobacterium sp.]
MNKKIIKFLIVAAAAAAGIVFCFLGTGKKGDVQIMKSSDLSETEYIEETYSEAVPQICIHISGEVMYPGVYYLDTGARLFEAVDMAGGFTENACEDSLNLAAVLEDGQHIYVPDIRITDSGYADDIIQTGDGRININTASLEELKTLPGIGDSRASDIIEYRSRQKFEKIEDIMNISGIKENLFNRIKDLIKV